MLEKFELLKKIPLFKLYRNFGVPRMLPVNLTVSLTYRCNSRCKTCNIYDRKSDELSLEEYGKIFRSLGRSPYWITFSGGEPFLRQDIEDICIEAYETCKPKFINIPTNGILSKRIEEGVGRIVRACSDASIIINLSVDALGDKDSEIRGVPGAFEKFMETYRRLKAIDSGNLTLGIHTVISKYNVSDMPNIFLKLKELSPDSYITEIAENRVELMNQSLDIQPSLPEYSAAVDFITEEMQGWDLKGASKIVRAFRKHYYRLVKDILRDGRMFIPCYAGYASCQISPEGDLWACCMRAEVMGNLRETGYDFNKAWFSENAHQVRKAIKDRSCFCPLANASYTNMFFSLKTLFRVIGEAIT
jgi:MoaA/NifB/PqqE/SkfB family radical SAM enzyme